MMKSTPTSHINRAEENCPRVWHETERSPEGRQEWLSLYRGQHRGEPAAGMAIGASFKVPRRASALVTVGTSSCGGSAIAAVSPILDASEEEISVAMGTVFLLNSIALFIFPAIGHAQGVVLWVLVATVVAVAIWKGVIHI
jgi:hypothetical protein